MTKQLIDSKISLNVTNHTTCWSLAQISTKFWTAKLVDSYKTLLAAPSGNRRVQDPYLSTELTENLILTSDVEQTCECGEFCTLAAIFQ